jgi:hypothetical protein
MGWEIGYDEKWKRDIGYGVPAYCDHPDCNEEIDRGLANVCCGQAPYGGDYGCGLYFCSAHRQYHVSYGFKDEGACGCERCAKGAEPFTAKPDVPEWINHKLTHESWQPWRDANPDEVARLSQR